MRAAFLTALFATGCVVRFDAVDHSAGRSTGGELRDQVERAAGQWSSELPETLAVRLAILEPLSVLVDLHDDGRVVFIGAAGVNCRGVLQRRTGPQEIHRLARELEDLGPVSIRREVEGQVFDVPLALLYFRTEDAWTVTEFIPGEAGRELGESEAFTTAAGRIHATAGTTWAAAAGEPRECSGEWIPR